MQLAGGDLHNLQWEAEYWRLTTDYQHDGLSSSDIFMYIKKVFGSIFGGLGVFSYVPCIWIYRWERNSFRSKTARKAGVIDPFQTLIR